MVLETSVGLSPCTLHTKLQKEQLCSIHTTTYFHNCNDFSTVFFYMSNDFLSDLFLRKIFAVLCKVYKGPQDAYLFNLINYTILKLNFIKPVQQRGKVGSVVSPQDTSH